MGRFNLAPRAGRGGGEADGEGTFLFGTGIDGVAVYGIGPRSALRCLQDNDRFSFMECLCNSGFRKSSSRTGPGTHSGPL
jgi:hypothetical protein